MERAKLLGLAPIGSLHRDVVQALGEMGYTLVAKEESAGIVGIKRTFLVEYHPLLIRLTYDALLKCHFVDGVLTMVETELYIHGLI